MYKFTIILETHMDNTNLLLFFIKQMLQGTHYIGEDILAHFEEGETWTKVFGPFFVYLNSTPDVSNAHNLWIDAKKQVPVSAMKRNRAN